MNAPAEGPLRVRLDGQAIEPAMASTVAGAFVRQVLNAPALAEVTFADPPEEQMGKLRFGARLSLAWGADAPLFEGEVTAMTCTRDRLGGQVVRVRGYDPLHRLRKRQQVRTLEKISAAGLARDAARSLGLSCRGGEAAPPRPFVIQYDQSDFELIVGLAGEAGYHLHLTDGELRLVDLGGEGETVTLRYGYELIEGSAEVNAESLRRSSGVEAVDLAHAQVSRGRAEHVSQAASDARKAALETFKGLGERTLTHRLDLDEDAARRLAQADLDHAAARGATLTATAVGDRRLRPAARVRIKGLGPLCDGSFVLSGALHLFTHEAGYQTEIWSEPPVAPRSSTRPLSTVGRVTAVDDPEDLSRVRVKLTACGDTESGWIPLVLPGAGEAKGLVTLPEPGDDVLLLFPDGDPARAVVLGGLYGPRRPPGHDERQKDQTRALLLATQSGAAIVLETTQTKAEFRSGGGDALSFTPDKAELRTAHDLSIRADGALTIEAKGDLTIEAAGHSVTIRAAAISLERG